MPKRLGWAALALGLALLGVGTPACDFSPSTTASADNGPVPTIDGIAANPRSTTGGDQPITLMAVAEGPTGKTLAYNWTATGGTLSSQSGKSVVWKPTSNDGAIATGDVTIKLVVTAGPYSTSATLNMHVGADGSVASNVSPTFLAPASSPRASATATTAATGAASPSPGASTTPTPAGSPASTACAVTDVVPTWAGPGTVLTVRGQGFGSNTRVSLGGTALTVLKRSATALAVLVPSDASQTDAALPVTVTGCGTGAATAGNVTVVDTTEFGDAAQQAGQGLFAEVETVDDGTDAVPNLASFKPIGSFVVSSLDFPDQGVRFGLPGPDGDLVRSLAIRYSGQIAIPTGPGGSTHFSLSATDGAKLYVDNKLVVDADVSTGAADGEVTLSAGKHAIRVDYLLGSSGVAGLTLYWTLPGASEVAVPASAFTTGFGP